MTVKCDPERKLNWREACELLGCGRSHFYNLISAGKLPATRYGHRRGVRVLASDCMAWLSRPLDEATGA